MIELFLEALIDSLKLLPFLFLTFLFLEFLENKSNEKSERIIKKAGKLGPLIGSLLGIIPQCGFSVAATNLYISRIISVGTLFAIYISTSDEMIPILLAHAAPISLIIEILIIKFLIAVVCGYIVDFFIKKKKENYNICHDEHCHCERGILVASIIHTFNIFIFIFVCNLIINGIMFFGGSNYLESLLLKNSIFGTFITGLIGLIPNCAASVILTELFLNNAISFGSLLSGLIAGAGIAMLVLFKIRRNKKEALLIISSMYIIGVFFGIIIEMVDKFI